MKELCVDVRMAMCSGIGTYIRNLISGLKEGPFKLRLIADPATFTKWPLLSSFDLILTCAPIYSMEEQIKLPFLIPSCDLFWSPHYNIPLMPIRAKKRMVTIHDVYHLAYGHALSFPKRMYADLLIPRAAKQSDLVITVSQFSRDELVKYVAIAPERVKVIHLGVDRMHFHPNNDVAKVLEKYNLPEKYLLFVGNLSPHKNVQGLLKSLQFLQDKTWKLVLVGAKTKAHIALEDKYDQAIFLGAVDDRDLPYLYQGAYATVHPSFYEGFGLTPLEAMSCGCPVVVSKVASLPEVCGPCAVYVDPHRPESIAQGIEEMASLREAFIRKGLKRSKTLSWDKSLKQHIEAIEKIL